MQLMACASIAAGFGWEGTSRCHMSNLLLQAGSDGVGKDQADQFLLLDPRDPHPPQEQTGQLHISSILTNLGLGDVKNRRRWRCVYLRPWTLLQEPQRTLLFISALSWISAQHLLGCPVENDSLSGESGDCTRAARKVRSCWRGGLLGSVNRGNARLEGSYGRPLFAGPDR